MALEEAHNLFSSERYQDDLDVWVRMAKQASKLKIGMLYATQEVTGVDHQVLANTKNWVVAHLNNSREVNELARFYDFKAFGDAIISHEDKGYVRLKTMSSPYIVPVHIDRYGIELVNEARAAARLPPLARSGAEAPDMPYDTITGGFEPASRLGHSEAAIRTLAERASFYVPAEHLRDLAWLRPKIRPKAGLPRPEGAGQPYDDHGGQPAPEAYPSLPAILDVVDRTGSSMYRDGLIPAALAHAKAAYPIGVGTDVLRLVARRRLGLDPPHGEQ